MEISHSLASYFLNASLTIVWQPYPAFVARVRSRILPFSSHTPAFP
jgi:hypothetical protein